MRNDTLHRLWTNLCLAAFGQGARVYSDWTFQQDLCSPAGNLCSAQLFSRVARRLQGGFTDKEVDSTPAAKPQQARATAGAGLLTQQLSSGSGSLSRESSLKLGAIPAQQHTHFMCISPDAPTNPVLYWVGGFDAKTTRFLLDGAKGPLKLDLGDVLYAPNLMKDAQVPLVSTC